MEKSCPCLSGKSYKECCEPYHKGLKTPEKAVDLMRARYSAFAVGFMDYVIDTHHPKTVSEINEAETKDWGLKSKWLGLEIVKTNEGEKKDAKGFVEFKAFYSFDGKEHVHNEIAEFERDDKNEWKFVTGYNPKKQSYVREEPKIGRNDPCSCGSGKKFKKCCSAA